MQLVSSKNGTVDSSAGVNQGSSTGDIVAGQGAPEELQDGIVHVCKDITVSSDSKV